jgi:hypothetical protein
MHARMGVVAAMALSALAEAPSTDAMTFTVSGTADVAGSCVGAVCLSLRTAVSAANAHEGADEIDLERGSYTLTRGAASGEDANATGDVDVTAASLRLKFTQRVGGRRVKGRCVAQTKATRRRRACRRYVPRGVPALAGHQALNRVSFQGRITSRRTLRPGRYRLVITASNAAGRVASKPLAFRIVK